MNYNKVIKDLKERNDKLQEQYRLRDMRCIHLEYENEMLKSDFEAQHELTKKYAEENQSLKKQLEVGEEQYNDLVEEKESLQEQLSSNTLQLEELKEQVSKGLYNTCLPYSTGYNKAIKDKETQQKEFIEYLENMLDNENDIFSVVRVKDVLSKYKEIIGVSDENNMGKSK